MRTNPTTAVTRGTTKTDTDEGYPRTLRQIRVHRGRYPWSPPGPRPPEVDPFLPLEKLAFGVRDRSELGEEA